MGFLLTLIVKALGELAERWFAQQNLIASGVTKQQLADQKATTDAIVKADAARNAVKPLTAIELSNIKPGTDPDFRD